MSSRRARTKPGGYIIASAVRDKPDLGQVPCSCPWGTLWPGQGRAVFFRPRLVSQSVCFLTGALSTGSRAPWAHWQQRLRRRPCVSHFAMGEAVQRSEVVGFSVRVRRCSFTCRKVRSVSHWRPGRCDCRSCSFSSGSLVVALVDQHVHSGAFSVTTGLNMASTASRSFWC